ncbi:MAG: apolipoprotein N-acyltransferase [Elusimicrobia bacterium]|nr:apolipoprotein N-acyltransferase [Elusimicrobiota bacterium]
MPRGRLARLIAAASAAALTALCYPRGGMWFLGWISFVPLFVALNAAASRREAAAAGFLSGWTFQAASFFWIYATCRFALIPVPVSLLAWGALSALLAVNWMVGAALGRWLTEISSRSVRPFIWAAVFTAVAVATERWTPRIPADMLGYTQWPNLALIQCASWGGPHLLGFAVLLVNAALAEAWLDAPSGETGPAAAPLALAFLLVGGLWIHGASVLFRRPENPGPTARVEILQPDIDQYRKWDAAYVDEILAGFNELLARPGTRPPSLVVWPETSIPRWTPRDAAVPEAARWARAQSVAHLVGIVAKEGPANAVQLIGPDGAVKGYYAKRELVPFGEYVPFRSLVPRFVIDRWLSFLDNFGDMSPGPKDPPLLATPFGATAVTICYEATFPRWARRDAARGARLLVNVTNDGWYKDTWAPSEHMTMNVFRVIENRLPEIRAGNTGISAVVDPWGVVTASLPLGARGRLDADVPLNDPFPNRSFYTRHGDWFGSLCLVFAALCALRRAFIRL